MTMIARQITKRDSNASYPYPNIYRTFRLTPASMAIDLNLPWPGSGSRPLLGPEQQARSGKLVIVTSALTVAEVAKLSGGTREEQDRQIRSYFNNSFVRIVPIDKVRGQDAARIVRDHGLKPPDALHVAVALWQKAKALCIYDGARGTGLLGLDKRVNGLRIVKPDDFWDQAELGFDAQ